MAITSNSVAEMESILLRMQQELQEYISESDSNDLKLSRDAQKNAEESILLARRCLSILKKTLVN